ncbi:RtcB family protein [Ottowia sp.]|uniref:RtcB family protein n=1 Tax=Ottowia sp. TaxID=1898956 RepID=UPI002BB80080|nr:RtcB family protein [Ottowia sp.]HRN76172.1 RtcB family protein [Ottowia sp.]HRQ03545.1 RtcB family protein [Ottowia sp.]
MLIFGTHDEQTLAQLRDVATRAERVALMADGHVGFVMPIGGVAAYRDQVSVVGVGFDIACGNCAIRTDLKAADFTQRQLLDAANEITETISFGLGRTNKEADAPVDHPLFDGPAWEALPDHAREELRDVARAQLGTVGSGNHYVDVFADTADDHIWVGVHFGSRQLGHAIASGFMALGQGAPWGQRVPEKEVLLALDSALGQRYWSAMELAGRYAYAGREYVARKVTAILGGRELDLVHNHHNYAWKEQHFGQQLVVVRKGATPAFPGQRGFIGGSMGDDAVIVAGYDGVLDDQAATIRELQQQALFSTVHGAGRVMSRTAARGARRGRRAHGRGAITRKMMDDWIRARGVIVRGGDVDESPHVYRRLHEVLQDQRGTIVVQHTLRPLIVVMAGPDVVDPFKD